MLATCRAQIWKAIVRRKIPVTSYKQRNTFRLLGSIRRILTKEDPHTNLLWFQIPDPSTGPEIVARNIMRHCRSLCPKTYQDCRCGRKLKICTRLHPGYCWGGKVKNNLRSPLTALASLIPDVAGAASMTITTRA